MNRFGAVIVLVVATVVGGCSGSSSGGEAAKRRATTTTTIPPLDTAALWKALPGTLELPVGWTSSGGAPNGDFKPEQGPGKGLCGGPNSDGRATAAGAVAEIDSSSYKIPQPGGSGSVQIIAFPNADAAATFMKATSDAAIACPQGIDYQSPESEAQIFSPGSNGNTTWNVHESASVGPAGDVPADESFILTSTQNYSTQVDSHDYRVTTNDVRLQERHGDVVIAVDLNGQSGVVGFSNNEETPPFVPTALDLIASANAVRPGILKDVGRVCRDFG